MKRAAAGLGFEYVGDAPASAQALDELGPFALFHRSVERRAVANQMRGRRGEYELLVLDFSGRPSMERARQWRTVVRIGSPTMRLPPFLLEHRSAVEEVAAGPFGARDRVDLEPPLRVPDEYVLTGRNESAVRAAFGPPVVAFLQSPHRRRDEARPRLRGDRLLRSRP
jgi:hypothetical protein